MSNNSLEVKKENIFTKIVSFFKNLFGGKKQENIVSENIINEEQKNEKVNTQSDFLDYIRVNKEEKEDPELLRIQEMLEKNEISPASISDEALNEITQMYERQVSNLKKDLEDKKTKINYLKYKLNSPKTNM